VDKLTGLNVWNVPLKDEEIRAITSDCKNDNLPATSGLVMSWSQVRFVEGFGGFMKTIAAEEVCRKAKGNFCGNRDRLK